MPHGFKTSSVSYRTGSAGRKIAHAYEEAYRTAFDAEEISYRQENAGRKAANTRLRLYVERYSRASQGMTTAPPLVGQNRVAA